MKKITVNIPQYIKSVVDKEEMIMWAKTPNISIPELKYPKMRLNRVNGYAFFAKLIKEVESVLP